jgi:hypothetical protein
LRPPLSKKLLLKLHHHLGQFGLNFGGFLSRDSKSSYICNGGRAWAAPRTLARHFFTELKFNQASLADC